MSETQPAAVHTEYGDRPVLGFFLSPGYTAGVGVSALCPADGAIIAWRDNAVNNYFSKNHEKTRNPLRQ